MKLLVISDLHANNSVLDKLDAEFKACDAVIFGGDFAECFKPETGKSALDALCKKHDNIFAVLGNCDNEAFMDELENADICAEKSLVYFDGLGISGSGGGTYFTGKTEFERSEDEILEDYAVVENAVKENNDESLWHNLILISHNPPKADIVDKVNETLHAGSQKFTDFIKEKQPLCVVCGHIHEGVGIEKIGETTVINPGALGEKGSFVLLEIEKSSDGNWKVLNAELKTAF
ncbi:MAG: metallophosphoesterase family protein [Spirochaetales bacterium]|nr:metallophosphoesterase family protein [Spirochaetales bacterium]